MDGQAVERACPGAHRQRTDDPPGCVGIVYRRADLVDVPVRQAHGLPVAVENDVRADIEHGRLVRLWGSCRLQPA